jgi:hypothetical protein
VNNTVAIGIEMKEENKSCSLVKVSEISSDDIFDGKIQQNNQLIEINYKADDCKSMIMAVN